MNNGDYRNSREQRIRRRKRRAIIKYFVRLALIVALLVFGIVMVVWACTKPEDKKAEIVETPPEVEIISFTAPAVTLPVITEAPSVEPVTEAPTEAPEPVWGVGDPDNDIYPFNMMSKDWGADVYEGGWRYFTIPEEYKREGGCFPEVVQVYLWSLCEQRNINYYMVLALIERESGYKYTASGDSGNSKGYMQIYEKWHRERMAEEGCDDLYNPYGNIRVGLSIIEEIWSSYGNSGDNCCLMVYNMGAKTAKENWAKGVYSTAYSRGVLARAEEIKQELTQE